MNDIQLRVMREDMDTEYQLRLQLRETLWQTLDFLEDPYTNEEDKTRVIALINQTLEETAP
jgi:hypothetical protein